MPTRALILGGGGPIGVAWETGLMAGLDEQGIAVRDADYIVGTSAGSIVGAMLALGRHPQEMLAQQFAIGENEAPPRGSTAGAFDLAPLMQHFIRLYTSDGPPEELRREIGKFALEANVAMTEDEWLATFGQLEGLGAADWPGKNYTCTAVDAVSGEFVTWTKDSGVPLGRAIASSCCVPGIFPPITINGRRYIDGGMRSATNADLAKGYDRALVVSVTSGMQRPGAPPQMVERARKRMDDELGAITAAGGAYEMIAPDDGSREAFGNNLMDFTRRSIAAKAGYAQAKNEAPRLRDLWS
jgi:NTE family protein